MFRRKLEDLKQRDGEQVSLREILIGSYDWKWLCTVRCLQHAHASSLQRRGNGVNGWRLQCALCGRMPTMCASCSTRADFALFCM
jgi:hypothetical protein